MPVMNFDLEDGLPPVSFSLKPDDCDRFMAFMAECQAIKEAQPKREPLTDEQLDDAVDAWFKTNADGSYPNWRERMRAAIEAAHGIKGEA